MFDRELRYLNAGGTGLSAMGLSSDMLVGHTIFDLYSADTADILAPLYRSALAGTESNLDVKVGDRTYRQRLATLRDDHGAIFAATGFVQDVTGTRRHDRDLHRSEELFRLTFQFAPFAMALISLDGRYERVNPAMCALTGYAEAELVGLTIADITHPDDVADDLAAVAALVAGERDSVVLEKRYLTPGGDCIWAAKSATLMRRSRSSSGTLLSTTS